MKRQSEKTKLIHTIERVWKQTNKGRVVTTDEERNVTAAIGYTLGFLELYDALRGENHTTYFTKRFLSTYDNMTQIRIATEYGLCPDSVSAYCAMYIKIFGLCLDKIERSGSADMSELLRAFPAASGKNRKKRPILA